MELKPNPSRVAHTPDLQKKTQPPLPTRKGSNLSTQKKVGNDQLSSIPVKSESQLTVTTIWLRLAQS